MHDSDIVCFTETHLRDDDSWPLTNITGSTHSIFRSSRTNSRGGGLAVCVKPEILTEVQSIIVTRSCELICVKLLNHDLSVICVYRPPRGNKNEFQDELLKVINCLPHESCIITGDFNIDYKANNCSFANALASHSFNQVVESATTDQGTLLDHVYLRNLTLTTCHVYDTYYSYHDKVECYVV